MISLLRRYRQGLITSVLVIFMIGIFVGLGGYYFTGADHSEAVAVVGKSKIPYLAFRARVNQYLDTVRSKKGEVPEAEQSEIKQAILRDMIVDELLASAAEQMGLRVSDTELAMTIQNVPAFRRDGRFDQQLYFQVIRYGLKTSPERFEGEEKRALLSAKLKAIILRSAKVLPGELREEYLRAHEGSGKGFDKEKDGFLQELRQRRAFDAVNFFLRQLSTQVDIRSYLDQRERGL